LYYNDTTIYISHKLLTHNKCTVKLHIWLDIFYYSTFSCVRTMKVNEEPMKLKKKTFE